MWIITPAFYHEKGVGDIEDSHDYRQEPKELEKAYLPLTEGKSIDYMNAPGRPTMISEFGGCRYGVPDCEGSYGYGISVTEKEFCERFRGLTSAILNNPVLTGFCYTQLYDVEQELNGLMFHTRKIKLDPELLYEYTTSPSEWEKCRR